MLGAPLFRSIFASNVSVSLQASRILTNCANYKNGILYLRFHSAATCKHAFQWPRQTNEMVHRFTLPRLKLIGNSPLRRTHTKDYILNTDVKKNVLLYEYLNQKSINTVILVGIAQLIIWCTVSGISYTPDFWTIFRRDVSFNEYIKMHAFRLTTFVGGLTIGLGTFACSWVLCTRCVKYLILHKGGKKVTLVTYNPVQRSARLQVPAEHVTCDVSLKDLKSYVPLKVQGTFLYYVMDAQGKFYNISLFNNVIGINRQWHNAF